MSDSAPALAAMQWSGDDSWILAIGAVTGWAAAIPGSQLLLSRQSMFPEALGHGALPGLVVGALLTGLGGNVYRASPLLIGALVAAGLVVLLVEGMRRILRIEPGAALGIAATTMFALGQAMRRGLAPDMALDLHSVLFGSLVLSTLDRVDVLGALVPRAFLILLAVALLNTVAFLLLRKETVLSGYDPQDARLHGIPVGPLGLIWLLLTAITALAAFQVAGAILVVGLMVAPPLAARMWFPRVEWMVPSAALLGAIAVAGGHGIAVTAGSWLQVPGLRDLHSAGCAAVLAGVLALVAVLSPRR